MLGEKTKLASDPGAIKSTNTAKKQIHKAELGDFTVTTRTVPISILAILIGLISTGLAWLLLRLIGLVTNLFYYQRWDTALSSPAGSHLGWIAIFIPVIGSLIVGFMARYGSEKIRGHGMPEAIESILMSGSRVAPKLALLKPVSAAVSIGSGGPFGAEGPIIMTGGAAGSMIAQFFHLTGAERKSLLVAGASAGMAAVFAAPLSATLLAVELLLFEWKPRSLIPVALASATAGIARRYVLGVGPIFPVPHHPAVIGLTAVAGCAGAGLIAGFLSLLLTVAVYAAEDAFGKLPIHWMWWPAIGGLFVGIGGFIFPQALGVGYDVIGILLQGNVPLTLVTGVLIVKSLIWAISLGSGTSGGVVAPLLMIGAALGGVEGMFLPGLGAGFWPLVSMGATLAGTMRVPFTGVVFALELTNDFNMLLPLLIACFCGYAVTVFLLKRSILTEKIARRGYHLTREYSIDPLEIFFVREVMRTKFIALYASASVSQIRGLLNVDRRPRGQKLFPVLDGEGKLTGVIGRSKLLKLLSHTSDSEDPSWLTDSLVKTPVVAFPNEPLRNVVNRMAEVNLRCLPVVEEDDHHRIIGIISLEHLLRARVRNLQEERARERILRIRLPKSSSTTPVGP